MIVELFGPPGAGKTTFANALTTSLRESGHVVELTLSCRPAERPSRPRPSASRAPGSWITPAAHRLTRPIVEMLAIARHPVALSHDIGAAAGLIRLMPPRKATMAFRLTQYILRLLHSWYHAAAAGHIVLFDQAFVQVVCSLALLGRARDERLIARALDCLPRPDLLIRVEAPPETLAARLSERVRRQGPFERLLERDVTMYLDSGIIDHVHELLRSRDQRVVSASSLDEHSLRDGVQRIQKELVAMFIAKRRATSS
jgi:thymidylate kinase